jgi:DNA polymerase III subunit alpha
MSDFIHLHNHTHFSLLDGACSVDGLVDAAAENNMPAVALTDHGVMFGAIEFYKKAKKRGIKPIIGNEMYMVTKGSRRDKSASETHPEGKRHGYNHLVLLAKNETGYKNLIMLTTLGHTEGFYYKPRIDFELLEKYHEGLVALTACSGGVVASYLNANDYTSAREVAQKLRELFGDDVYLEIQDHGLDRERVVTEGMLRLSDELGMKLIATNDCHYIKPDHAVAHNVFLHIADVREAENITNLRYETDQVYFKSEKEMLQLFRRHPAAVEATVEVMEKCNLSLDLGIIHMPHFPIPDSAGTVDLNEYMRSLAEKGLETRYPFITQEIRDRLAYEIDVISRMGYAGYFLIVQDFISAARSRGIRVGPGRGSAAGSLVAFALGITDVDPLRYNLLFERFLNPDRISMPDIDVDFQDERREEVIQYVREKYGEGSVSQIITFNKLSARAVIKDVGRVLGIPLNQVESITKQIPVRMGKVSPLKYALGLDKDPDDKWQATPELAWVRDSPDPKIGDLVRYSLVLEDFIRGAGMHAAGVVIAPSDTSAFVPLYKTPSTELMTMYNMNDLEEAGLLKMDFLGLITLTVIERAVALIQKTRGLTVDIDKIPLDDERTFDMIGEGRTVGVFQFESVQMREYLRKLKPKSIDDLAAMNALYRPGPMEFIDDFIDRKYGRKKIEYLHPRMESILAPTYGIIVFQEQVMQLASEIAGFTLAQSDLMRRAMGKKKRDVMEQQRDAFMRGAMERGIEKKIASEIFDLINKFADYGFNKSHSVAYSLLAYQTAWIKANYSAEFMAAMMTSEMSKTEKVAMLIDECARLGIEVLPPDVNASAADFSVADNRIRFGLAAIKNVGGGAVEDIVRARSEGEPFKSIFEFSERLENRAVNKKTLESLVLAGAMDSLQGNRAQLFATIEPALSFRQQRLQNRESGQSSLFDDPDGDTRISAVYPLLPIMEEWTDSEKLAKEKSVLGFYVSGHPLEPWRMEVEAIANVALGDFNPALDGITVRACGIIAQLRTKIDKRNRRMAFVTLEDFTGKAECLVFADPFERFSANIAADKPIVMIGKLEASGDAYKIIAEEIYSFEEAIAKLSKGLVINLSTRIVTRRQIDQGIEVLNEYRGSGDCPCFITVSDGNDASWNLYAKQHRIRSGSEVLRKLRDIFGRSNVRIALDD